MYIFNMYLYRNIACPPLQRPYETSPNQDGVQQPRCLESTRLQLVRSSGEASDARRDVTSIRVLTPKFP